MRKPVCLEEWVRQGAAGAEVSEETELECLVPQAM